MWVISALNYEEPVGSSDLLIYDLLISDLLIYESVN